MPSPGFHEIVKAVLIAALAAAMLTATFHFVFTERVIQQAIELEEQAQSAGGEERPVVSRPAQKAGLFVGFLMYGVVAGLFLGGLYFIVRRWLSGTSSGKLGFLLALAAYWSVALFPFLKYPANPPGVGDPETIYHRQQLYLGIIGLSLAGGILAYALYRSLTKLRGKRLTGLLWVLPLTVYGSYMLVIYLVMPTSSDPVSVPMELVSKFRALSLAGLTLFWLLLGSLSYWLLNRQSALRVPIQQPSGGSSERASG